MLARSKKKTTEIVLKFLVYSKLMMMSNARCEIYVIVLFSILSLSPKFIVHESIEASVTHSKFQSILKIVVSSNFSI